MFFDVQERHNTHARLTSRRNISLMRDGRARETYESIERNAESAVRQPTEEKLKVNVR